MHVQNILSTHPMRRAGETSQLVDCIEACIDCAQACTACADACLSEDNVAELKRCILLDLDCADLCEVTARLLIRVSPGSEQLRVSTLMACQLACQMCADECEKHQAHHEHCRQCAEACRTCAEACGRMFSSIKH